MIIVNNILVKRIVYNGKDVKDIRLKQFMQNILKYLLISNEINYVNQNGISPLDENIRSNTDWKIN